MPFIAVDSVICRIYCSYVSKVKEEYMDNKVAVSAEEFSKMLGCSKAHIYRLVKRNELKHIKLGRRVFIPNAVVKEIIGEQVVA